MAKQQINVEKLIKTFRALPRGVQILLVVLVVVGVVFFLFSQQRKDVDAVGPGEYLFCFWNAENLFDDRDDDRTRKLDGSRRILEGHIRVGGHQLVVIASHWRSRVETEDGDDGSESRATYADLIHGRFQAMYKTNPAIDFLVCGDFNDDPTDRSLTQHLHATGDRDALTVTGRPPRLFNLAAGKDIDTFGTLSYHNKWHLFDQIVASPGLLDDKGWACLPQTFRTVREPMANKRGHPWRFDEDIAGRRYYDKQFDGKRGFADHFPVTVRLKVHGP